MFVWPCFLFGFLLFIYWLLILCLLGKISTFPCLVEKINFRYRKFVWQSAKIFYLYLIFVLCILVVGAYIIFIDFIFIFLCRYLVGCYLFYIFRTKFKFSLTNVTALACFSVWLFCSSGFVFYLYENIFFISVFLLSIVFFFGLYKNISVCIKISRFIFRFWLSICRYLLSVALSLDYIFFLLLGIWLFISICACRLLYLLFLFCVSFFVNHIWTLQTVFYFLYLYSVSFGLYLVFAFYIWNLINPSLFVARFRSSLCLYLFSFLYILFRCLCIKIISVCIKLLLLIFFYFLLIFYIWK